MRIHDRLEIIEHSGSPESPPAGQTRQSHGRQRRSHRRRSDRPGGRQEAPAVPAIGRQFGLSVFSIIIATPAAWAATLGRSVLAGIGTTIGILVTSQVSVIAGSGGWFPFAAPALWAINTDIAVTPVQLALVLPVVALGIALTLHSWQRLQLDR